MLPREAGAAPSDTEADACYFEQQSLMQCARHALNNMLGRPAFSSAALDAIATSLPSGAYSLAHRWPVLGNHDVVRPPAPMHTVRTGARVPITRARCRADRRRARAAEHRARGALAPGEKHGRRAARDVRRAANARDRREHLVAAPW